MRVFRQFKRDDLAVALGALKAFDAEMREALTELKPQLAALQGGIHLLAEEGSTIPIETRRDFAVRAESALGAMIALADRMLNELE